VSFRSQLIPQFGDSDGSDHFSEHLFAGFSYHDVDARGNGHRGGVLAPASEAEVGSTAAKRLKTSRGRECMLASWVVRYPPQMAGSHRERRHEPIPVAWPTLRSWRTIHQISDVGAMFA
jgi:hypothetical protein